MPFWLLKTEPSTYSFTDLERDRRTVWDGIINPLALQNLRRMKRGDRAFIYHSGSEKQIIGIADITSNSYPDPKQPKDTKLAVVNLSSRERLPRPVTLAEIKARHEFAHWELVWMPRLSVMTVSDARWKLVHQLAGNSQ